MLLAGLLAVLIGVSLGLLGGGGSILAVPLLVYIVGLGPRDAVATSLLVVGVASLAAMIPHWRGGRVSARVGLPFGFASMVGAFAGGRIAHFLPEKALLAGFTGIMVVTALAMMRRRPPAAEGSPRDAVSPPALGRAVLVGVAIGLLTGIVGAGGGFVIVPALVLFCGLPMPNAVGTSLLVITMNSLAAFAGAVGHASIPWATAAVLAGAAVAGSAVGATQAKRVPASVLRKGFAVFVLVMAFVMAWKQLPPSFTLSTPAVIAGLLAVIAAGGTAAFIRARRASASSRPT